MGCCCSCVEWVSVTSVVCDAGAAGCLQVPDAADDLLAAEVLDQQPQDRLSQQAREALAALPELFPITVSACGFWQQLVQITVLLLLLQYQGPARCVPTLNGTAGTAGAWLPGC